MRPHVFQLSALALLLAGYLALSGCVVIPGGHHRHYDRDDFAHGQRFSAPAWRGPERAGPDHGYFHY